MFSRALITSGQNVNRAMNAGDGYIANPRAFLMVADANSTITVADIAGGLILRSGATAGRTDTTPTATLLAAALVGMDIGDTYTFKTSVQVAFAITYAGGTGVTASGNLVIAANGYKEFILEKTGAATFNLIGL